MGRELRKRSHHSHPLSIPKDTAWDSNEHILAQQYAVKHDSLEDNRSNNQRMNGISKEITVVQETIIQSEPLPAEDESTSSDPSGRRYANPISKFAHSVNFKRHDW